ncbi:hypothetical protein [Georgenia muralis]|uniref:Uncharacterized protein n=1 Tax=Georgenia muralis TaxID=154117 RepID=A0A3N5ABE6_9MICO|nr:hypothetical protein [Georgenia muralis]RPF28971.1 hypothetical protein EDD32_3522 [Georgenia muralis]
MSVDREVVTRRLVSMRQLLDHLDIRSPEVLDDMAVRLHVERILTQLVNLAVVARAVPAALTGYRDYVRQVARALSPVP